VGAGLPPPAPKSDPALHPPVAHAAPDRRASVADSLPGDDWNAEFVAYERQRLIDALSEAGGSKSVAARSLGMPRSTFCSKLKKHGVT
jgi:transcriptional regulator of acetoin/glycerol metabolism